MSIFFRKVLNLFCFLALCCVAICATQVYAEKANVDQLVTNTKEQRRQEFARISKLITQAREAAYKEKFPEASAFYQKANRALKKINGELSTFKKRSLQKEIKKFKSAWASYLLKKARRARLQKKFEDAINFAAEAILIDTGKNAEVTDFIESCKKERKGLEFRNKTRLANFNKKVIEDDKSADKIYREAEVFFRNKKYNKVRKLLEQVFIIDPYHKKAIRLLGQTYDQMYRYANERRVADVQGMLAYNTWKWIDPVLPTHLEKATTVTRTVQQNIASSTYAKLERIIFPNIEFDDADIFSVIRYLNRLSKRCDPDKQGISVIAGFDKNTADELFKVTMSFSNIPLSEVLRYLCQNVGLKYKIEEGAVILGTSVDEMQTEYFSVRADLISSITGSEIEEDGEGGGDSGDDEDMSEKEADFFDAEKTFEKDDDEEKSRRVSLSSQALIKFFEDRGVKFGRGATIAYNRRSGKLVVKNTLINLRRLSDLLRQYDLINTPLVLIETKLVEITVTDIEQLGFRWNFDFYKGDQANPDWEVKQNYTPLRYFNSTSDPNATFSPAQTTSIPFNVLNQLSILPNFAQDLFPDDVTADLTLTIQAIAQNNRTETLSAPKLITTSGQEATIRMVEETYYPSSWKDPEININNNTVQVQAPIPEFDDSTDIGIRMTVTPIVNPDNYTITLHVKPEVVSFIDYSRFPINLQQGVIENGNATPSINTVYIIRMPILGRRDIDTHIKVYDGETIILGGMIDNRNVYRDDKWPIIGDIPFVGRLFSSQLALTTQTNLLIFLTARLINNDGVPVRRGRQNGIPDFYR